MRPVHIGVQWTSRLPRTSRQRLGTPLALTVMCALVLSVAGLTAPAVAATDYLLMSRSELLARPTSGNAWNNLKSVANGSLGSANLCDQDNDHHLRTLAAALVYARTGTSSYATKARGGVMAAIKTQKVGCGNAALALGRQLTAYVLAADFANLSGTDDATFKAWLKVIRSKNIGGHSTRNSLYATHRLSVNNWGAYAGASRIAASLYLGDTADVGYAAAVTQGFLGDRAKYAKFKDNMDSQDMSWSCASSASSARPTNGTCTKSGINVDGAIIADVSRSGSLDWPPGQDGVQYQLDSIQGVGLQVELLYQNGYTQAWSWSNKALKRAANLVTRSRAAGGTGWNETNTSRQMPWLLNKRYGTSIPTAESGMGRAIGFTDWLWGGGGGGGGTPAPKPKPTPKPTPGDRPVVTAPSVRLSTTSSVPSSGIPVVVLWGLSSIDDPLRRYELEIRTNGGSWSRKNLTGTSYRLTLSPNKEYTFRLRAVDKANRVGWWKMVGPFKGSLVSDTASSVDWSGTWGLAASSSYLGGKVHWTNRNGSRTTLRFSGTAVAWIGPVGPTRGKAQVYIDGKYVKSVDLKASKFAARRILFATALPAGKHRIEIKGLGTSGRPTVAVDGFYVVQPS